VVAVVLGVRAFVLHWAGGPVALAGRLDWIRRAGRRHEGEDPAGREAVWTRQELPQAGTPRPRTEQPETLPAETLQAETSQAGMQRSQTQAGR
jgi:hypothetical protein